jgi:tetratricopeptide (TPR) repeat protein
MPDRLPLLLQLLEANPGDTFGLFAVAKEYEGRGDRDLALAYYLKLRETDPGYVGLYYHLGKLYEQLDQPEAALEAYEAGIETARQAGDDHARRELQGAYLEAGGDAFE